MEKKPELNLAHSFWIYCLPGVTLVGLLLYSRMFEVAITGMVWYMVASFVLSLTAYRYGWVMSVSSILQALMYTGLVGLLLGHVTQFITLGFVALAPWIGITAIVTSGGYGGLKVSDAWAYRLFVFSIFLNVPQVIPSMLRDVAVKNVTDPVICGQYVAIGFCFYYLAMVAWGTSIKAYQRKDP